MPKPIQLLFIKSGIANRQGLSLKPLIDSRGHPTKRWKKDDDGDWRDEENWHTRTMKRMRTLSDESLRYIIKDATEAARALESHGTESANRKAGQYQDEAHYAGMELRRRQQGGDMTKSDIANRPGLALQNVTDKGGHQTKRWKRTAQEMKAPKPVKGPEPTAQARPAGKAPDLQPGHRVKFQAGEHQGQGEVTAVGKDGVTVKDASGREHGVHHHELTHHAPAKGEGQAKPESKPEQPEPKAESQEVAALPDEHVTAIAKAAADPAKYAELPKSAKQPSADPDELYQKAEEGLQQLKKWLNMGNGVASQMGYQTMTKGPDKVTDEEWDKPGGMLFIAGLKARDGRAAEKVQKDYKGDWSQLADIVRCTLAADSLNDLSDAIKTLEGHGMKVAKQPKNKFLKPTPQGYRDMNFVVTLPNGMLAEVQFNVKDMLRAKNIAHHFYEETRSINGKYNEQGIGDPDNPDKEKWSQEDVDAYNAAEEKQVEIYSQAWVDHVKKHYGSDKTMVKSILLLWRLK